MSNAGWRQWAKRLVPPILLEYARPGGNPPIWNGVYPTLADVPARRADYNGELIDEMVTTTRDAMAQWRAGRKPLLWHEPFALVAGLLAARRDAIRVIDFGGGVGSGFAQLLSSLPASVAIDYLVVDNDAMCASGRDLFKDDPRIRFVTDLPAAGPAVDIVYVNSVLQYISDYKGALTRLAAVGADAIFLARFAAGGQPVFASEQLNLPGRVLPYWFLNVGETITTMAASGYELAADSFAERAYDQSNLPESHRVERFRNMLFVRQTGVRA